jgi:hypothetical protein
VKTGSALCTIFALVCFGAPVAAQMPVPASQRMKACDRQIALAAAEEILTSPESLKEPVLLHDAAAVLFVEGRKDEAVFWSWVAHLRSWYGSPYPKIDELLTNMRRPTAPPIANYALQDTGRFEQILARAQKRDRETPSSIPEERDQVYRRLDELRARITAERDEIEKQARAAGPRLEQEHASRRGSACLKVLIHPSDARRQIASEQALVVAFVTSQPEVIEAVGVVAVASPVSHTVPQDHLLPSQYDVAVKGNKVVFAIVDVSRDATKAEFKLACITRTPLGGRDPFKDPCKQ